MKHYFNVVRAGSRVSNPSAKMLDTGENLKVETLKGAEVQETRPRSRRAGAARDRSGRHLVSRGAQGQSTRLRISETYTDPGRYSLEGDELVWDRAFGRPRNTVVLACRMDRRRQLDSRVRSPRMQTAVSACTSRIRDRTRFRL